MKITINGTPQEIAAGTVAEVLELLGQSDAVVATALNESFVPAGARAGAVLHDGDRLEIVAPRQGG
ncbi:sulfur carrier protein ThiS [Sagittula sp. SSi028]|uniref:sulfur carrier protein ThiS n=1 Tax=Sagittula sp. SSi028 TaxID=3400636 RepID=UPI003AF5E97C